ncbi:hypothetical protein K435DRAFT_809261 [Dendrothele bispora CBS 962.96]|uniref:Uncharacterized protein n=1 Tax=Dendrothele bispora (strain CBS 962.96) TaxID=1314807 RepID=A0A4S8KYT2_DENBC|nr:hypothetical protein K435DRAFT_809261 [Dendrothele bispora CBS 962.96]
MTGAERKQQKNKHGGARAGSGRKPREVIVPEVSSDGIHVSGHNAHLPPHPIFTATRLASTTQSESNNNPGISVEINAPNLHSGSNAGNLFSDTNDSVPNSASARYASTLPPTQLSTQKSRKGKEKAIEPQTDDLTTTLPFNDIEMADVFGTSPTNEDFMVKDSMETQDAQDASGSANVAIKTKTTSSLHSESVGSGSGSIKKAKKKAKRCGLCRDATCSQAEACPGSGGSRFCTCNHTFPEGIRRRIRH